MLRFCDSSPSRSGGRQNHPNCGAFPVLALGFDPTAMELNNMLYDGQAEAGPAEFAAAGLVRAIKSLENPRQIVPANPHAIIADSENDFAVALFGRKTNRTSIA